MGHLTSNNTHVWDLDRHLTVPEMRIANILQMVWDTILAFDPEQPSIALQYFGYAIYYTKGMSYHDQSPLIQILHKLAKYDINAKYLITSYGYCKERHESLLQSEEM